MSEESVETVRRIAAAINDDFDVPRELYDPDFEADLTEVGGPLLRGIDAMLEQ